MLLLGHGSFHIVYSLNCYTCSNLLDDRCGTTWKFSDDDITEGKYIQNCSLLKDINRTPIIQSKNGNNFACRKLEYEDSLQGKTVGGIVVTRSCWISDGIYVPPTKCKKEYLLNSCYCNTNSCNQSCVLKTDYATSSIIFLLLILQYIFQNHKYSMQF